MKTTAIPCPERVAGPSECGKLERPRYFPRQLITPEELNLEQRYFRDRLRRHNRLLHGWGVVCGAMVCPVPSAHARLDDREREEGGKRSPKGNGTTASDEGCEPCSGWEPWKVRVEPGYILGPFGDEIVIDTRVVVDIRQPCTAVETGDCWSQASDPWCSDVTMAGVASPIFVAVKFKEMKTRPVRVPPPGCGCDELECDYSRWCDGYEICSLTERPDSHRGRPVDEPEVNPGCPPCPDEPWVVLAKVEFDDNGCIRMIDNCGCRRLVRSHACYWWECRDDPKEIELHAVPNGRERRAEDEIRHVGGGYYDVKGFEERVRSKRKAIAVARALAAGEDPYRVGD